MVTADEAAASEATLIVKETDTVRRGETPVIVTSDDPQGDVVSDPQMFPALPATTGLKAFWPSVSSVTTPARSTEKAAANAGSSNGALDGSFDGSLDG